MVNTIDPKYDKITSSEKFLLELAAKEVRLERSLARIKRSGIFIVILIILMTILALII